MTALVPGFRTRLLFASLAGLGLFAAVLFWPAGRIEWVGGWLYFTLVTSSLFVNFIYLRRVNPEVIEHRLRLGKGTKRWDKIWSIFFTPVFLAIYVVAGFDAVRFEWSTMPCSAKTRSLLSRCFTVVEIEHTAKPFAALNRPIG